MGDGVGVVDVEMSVDGTAVVGVDVDGVVNKGVADISSNELGVLFY